MARISCGHCGGMHESVAEVRACSTGNEHVPRHGSAGSAASTVNRSRPTAPDGGGARDGASDPALGVDAADLAGPDRLGRSILVGSSVAVPPPWTACDVVEIDAGPADSGTIDRLQGAWTDRERLVIRLADDRLREPGDQVVSFGRLHPGMEVEHERLHFLLTANAVNALGSGVAFEPVTRALAAGAVAADRAAGADGPVSGDVTLPDGSTAWVDGGPLDLDLAGHPDLGNGALIPRCHLVAGSIRPLIARSVSGTVAPSHLELAPDQQAAVEHRGGPARILAPAGSGKTRVLTERVRHLVDQCGIEPATLALVAYNRRAKAEMSERLAGTGRYHLDSIRTLNSLALAIATGRDGFVGGTPATTIDEREVRRILGSILPRQRRRQLNDPLEPWIDGLSMARLGLRDPDDVAAQFGGDLDEFGDVMTRYRRHLADNGLLDFDEQILRALEILASSRSAREQARRLMPLILIDEFQDLTPAHLLLVRLIAGPANEVFAVGDDDQTIYSFSGASPRWLIDFERFFPGAESHFLTVNYRCPPEVVTAADNLLSHNRHRVTKKILSSPGAEGRADTGSTDPLSVYLRGDPQDNLVGHVGRLLDSGVDPTGIAVLARVNAALLPAMLYLTESGVAVDPPAGVGVSMLERSGAGAALSWLRLAIAPKNGLHPDDLRLALRRPPRSVHPRIVDWICEQQSVWHLHKLADRLNTERDATSVRGLADDIAELQAMVADPGGADTEAVLGHVLHTIGLLGAAGQLDGSQRTARRAAHSDELLALLAVSRLHPDPDTFESWLRGHLESVRSNGGPESNRHAVTLATVHTTKGLEWPHVVVHDVRDGLYPHRLAEDPEEERRIFHVALTRGQASVAVTGSGPRSPFIDELGEKRAEPWPEPDASDHDGDGDDARLPLGRPTSGITPARKAKAGSKPERAEPATEAEARLRESLTQWRRQRAKADAVPAYVVLNNKTLDAIAATAPATLAELSAVPGIGPSRLDTYGDDILGVVAATE